MIFNKVEFDFGQLPDLGFAGPDSWWYLNIHIFLKNCISIF
jgi:hypothetical protein